MAQKINPISLRLGKTNRGMDSCWFNQSNYVNLLMKDLKIQKYIDLILKKIKFSSARYLIIYLPTKIKINIFFCNPSKNRKYVSKIFYLSYPKKHKIIQKNFFNSAYAGVSVVQSKIFRYLTKNFNNDLLFFPRSQKSTDLLCKTEKISNISENEKNSNNLFLSQNYSKLLHSLRKYNEFYLRYFLVKYFSMKQNFYFTKHEILNASKQKNNSNLSFCVAKQHENSLRKNQAFSSQKEFLTSAFFVTQKEKKHFTVNSLNNMHHTILFKYIIFFLFLKVYKNKNFLALNYFQIKINNYKKITQNSNAFSGCFYNIPTLPLALQGKGKYKQTKKLNTSQLKKNLYTINPEKKNNCNKFNECGKISLPIIFFFNTFLPLKFKILKFLRQKTLNYTFLHDLSVKKNSLFGFVSNNSLKRKFVPIFSNGNAFIKLNVYYKQLQFYSKSVNPLLFSSKAKTSLSLQKNLIDLNSKTSFTSVKHVNEKHCGLSLMNAECVNETYNNYCKLFYFSKYYENIYLRGNKSFFPLRENNELNNNTNSSEITYKFNNNLISSKIRLIKKKKFILPSSPYKSHMESILCNNFSGNVHLHFFQTSDIFKNALFLIDEIIYYIEKRVPFFKIKNYILKKITEQKSNHIKGIRVMCSGRIGGKSKKAQRSKVQNFKYGETSLHVFSSKIDFKSKNAFTSFGTLGIKVWICYN